MFACVGADYGGIDPDATDGEVPPEVWAASAHTPSRRGLLQFHIALEASDFFHLLPRSHRQDPTAQATLLLLSPALPKAQLATRFVPVGREQSYEAVNHESLGHRRRLSDDEQASMWISRGGLLGDEVRPGFGAAGTAAPALPGEIGGRIEPGEVLFWDGGLLHHGAITKGSTRERLELHCLAVGGPEWRGNPSHQTYMLCPRIRERLPPAAAAAYDRWRDRYAPALVSA